MDFRMLGPLEVRSGGGLVAVTGRHGRKVLALLLHEAGRVVPPHRIVGALWDGEPPNTATQQVQKAVSALRGVLGAEAGRIVTTGGGYRLDVARGEVDLLRCRSAESRASALRREGDHAAALGALREALFEWRGPALGGMSGRVMESIARELEEYRLALLEQRIDIELESGMHGGLVSELRGLVESHPYRQAFARKLMLALYRSGRAPEALHVYRDTAERLADELGIDPGDSLRELHTAILRNDPLLRTAPNLPDIAIDSPGPPVVPALVPADVVGFVGRERELLRLDGLMDGEGAAARLAVITGSGGMGKTTLAIHWAHRVASRFPDGRLYADLRGFDPSDEPVAAAAVIRRFLESLGVPPQRMPSDQESQADLYQSLLAERRVLVVLDNARDAEQIRTLLPGGGGTVTVVTSRRRLAGLVVRLAPEVIDLGVLSAAETRELLVRRLGSARVDDDAAAADRITEVCAGLPLALAITCARAAVRPSFPLSNVAEEICVERRGLGGLAADGGHDVRAVFSWSLHGLSDDAARIFRLLGLHPGPDFTAPAVASLAGVSEERARKLLEDLVDAQLLSGPLPGRYSMHDLLRAFAAELAAARVPRPAADAAVRRLVDHYVQSAHAAAVTDPVREPQLRDGAVAGTVTERFGDHGSAMRWLSAEHEVVLRLIRMANESGMDAAAWLLAWSISDFQNRRGRWFEGVEAQELALESARRRDDALEQASSHRTLAVFCSELHRYDEADRHVRAGFELAAATGNPRIAADAHHFAAILLYQRGHYAEALIHNAEARAFYERSNSVILAEVLMRAGWITASLGDLEAALAVCERALTLYEQRGKAAGKGNVLACIAFVRRHQGRWDEAVELGRAAVESIRMSGHGPLEVSALENLGDIHRARGDTAAARECWEAALALVEDLGQADTAGLTAKVATLDRGRHRG